MLSRRVARLASMDMTEIGWRSRAFARNTMDRVIVSRGASRWERSSLASALAPLPALSGVHAALKANLWDEAHRQLSDHFVSSAPRFLIAESGRASLVSAILDRFPSSAAEAAGRADRIVAGEYDLLGYRGLRFDHPAAGPDWHMDPVHGQHARRDFWTDVPYLDPECGDHKIIWELNRHQHWCALGRAYWLTGDPRYRERCIAECVGWLDANPPLVGINWASMLELAFRSLSWVWALHFCVAGAAADRTPWIVDLLVALDRQLTQIENNLSFYFSPNTHLTGEALALYVTGLALPELVGSRRRVGIGRQVLVDEIARQVLPDGGHSERSAHYLRYTLDFYTLALAVARATEDPAAALFHEAVGRLSQAARLLADDQGRLPRLGDDDGGMLLPMAGRPPEDVRDSLAIAGALIGRSEIPIGPVPEEAYWVLSHPRLAPSLSRLQQARERPGASDVRSAALVHTGYYVSRSPDGDHLVIDGGAHGDRTGAHAHADALSVTLTVRGTPLLIDAGTGCYTIDRGVRERLRSTTLHNTLVVDGRPQSIPAGPFSWMKTANGRVRRWITREAFDYFEGAHDGYYPIEHRRHILSLRGDLLVVADLIHGSGAQHTASVHWHFDPRWTVAVRDRVVVLAAGDQRCQLALPEGNVERFEADSASGLGWYSPSYGRLEPTVTIRVTHRSDVPFWMISAFGLQEDNPIVSARVVPVHAKNGRLAHATAVRLVRRETTDLALLAEPIDATGWYTGEMDTSARVHFRRSTPDGSTKDLRVVDGLLAAEQGR